MIPLGQLVCGVRGNGPAGCCALQVKAIQQPRMPVHKLVLARPCFVTDETCLQSLLKRSSKKQRRVYYGFLSSSCKLNVTDKQI